MLKINTNYSKYSPRDFSGPKDWKYLCADIIYDYEENGVYNAAAVRALVFWLDKYNPSRWIPADPDQAAVGYWDTSDIFEGNVIFETEDPFFYELD